MPVRQGMTQSALIMRKTMKIKLLVMLVAIVICLGSVQRLTGQAPFVDQAPPRFDSGWLEHTRFALPDSSWLREEHRSGRMLRAL